MTRIMLSQVAESTMHRVRWLIALAWIAMIVSLFYDPITPAWTLTFGATRGADGSLLSCIPVQNRCAQELLVYAIAPRVFWGMVIPQAIFVVLVLGHETWRRICPLYFLSQLPRALGIGLGWRVEQQSWLARHHLYVQFGLLFSGLCARILWINGDRILLGSFLILTIAAAMTMVLLFGGRSWCHYICPFGLVQLVFTGPRGLLDSTPVTVQTMPANGVTQSMCRTTQAPGAEVSACVGCKAPCLDIDSGHTYWHQLQPGRRWAQYGYLGLVVGYIVYYGLYAGSFEYYYSGVWNRELNPAAHIWDAGFYLQGRAIAVPKLLAVPLTLGAFALGFYVLGVCLERGYRWWLRRLDFGDISIKRLAQHRLFTLVTFLAFNIFFLYGGQPELRLLPFWLQYLIHSLTLVLSSFWMLRTWTLMPPQEAISPRVSPPLAQTLVRHPGGDRMVKTMLRR
jgi:hypothetical protein